MDAEALGQEPRLADPADAGSYPLAALREGLEVEVRNVAPLTLAQRLAQIVVREGEHPAVGVPDDEGLLSAKEMVRDDERADGVIAGRMSSVSGDGDVGRVETEPVRSA